MEARIYDMAAALYDGGWRAGDIEDLRTEYEWNEESGELEDVVYALKQFEEDAI